MPPPPTARKPAPTMPVAHDEKVPVAAEAVKGTPSSADRLVAAIAKVDTATDTPTAARSILGEYYKHVHRRMSFPDFPVTLHEHCRDEDRSTSGGNKWSLLYHAIGSAIKAYQLRLALERHTTLTPDTSILVQRAEEKLLRRLSALEALVAKPFREWKIIGNDLAGFRLEL